MTDTDVKVDLDEYAQTLKELNEEISAYGNERRSLKDLATTLSRLHQSSQKVIDGVEKTIGHGTEILQDLRDMELPETLKGIDSRYETHQTSLKSVTDTLQQVLQEQQRSALEMLQNAQHNKQALESHAESVKAGQEQISRQLVTLASEMEAIRTTQTRNEKQVHILRILLIVTVILIVAVGGLLITL